MSTAALNVSEHGVIAKVVQHYIDGGKSGKGDDMKPAFHEDATIFGYAGADLFAGPIQQLFAWVDENDPATGLQARIATPMGTCRAERPGMRRYLNLRSTNEIKSPSLASSESLVGKRVDRHGTGTQALFP